MIVTGLFHTAIKTNDLAATVGVCSWDCARCTAEPSIGHYAGRAVAVRAALRVAPSGGCEQVAESSM